MEPREHHDRQERQRHQDARCLSLSAGPGEPGQVERRDGMIPIVKASFNNRNIAAFRLVQVRADTEHEQHGTPAPRQHRPEAQPIVRTSCRRSTGSTLVASMAIRSSVFMSLSPARSPQPRAFIPRCTLTFTAASDIPHRTAACATLSRRALRIGSRGAILFGSRCKSFWIS